MIKKIKIINYRGIQKMELDNFKKYNIFVGDNSSCKTTVLEALFSSLYQNYDRLIVTANSRGMQVRTDNIHNFFYNADLRGKIEFVLNDEIITKITTRNPQNIENEKITENIGNERIFENMGNIPLSIINQNVKLLYNFLQEDMRNKKITDVNIMIDNFNNISIQEETIINYDEQKKSVWITPLSKYQSGVAQVVKSIIEDKKKKELMKVINILEPEIDDIVSDGFEVKLSKNNVKRMLSLSSFGNGLSSIISTISNLVNEDAKILFIDEIEDGIHYLNYSKFCNALIKIAEAREIQLFITTHSKEFIEKFYNNLRNDEENITLYRFQRLNNEVKEVFYSKENVMYALKEGWDIR